MESSNNRLEDDMATALYLQKKEKFAEAVKLYKELRKLPPASESAATAGHKLPQNESL